MQKSRTTMTPVCVIWAVSPWPYFQRNKGPALCRWAWIWISARLPGRAPFNLLRRNYSSRLPWEWVSLDCLKIGHIAQGTVRPGSRAHSKDAGIRTGNDVAVKWCQINTTGQSGVRSERKHVKGTNDAVEKRAEITDGGNAKWAGCWEKKGGGAA